MTALLPGHTRLKRGGIMKYKTELHTKRLILRRWQDSDAEDCYEYAKNPKVGPFAGWQAHTSPENSLEIIRTVLAEDGTYAVCLKEDNRAIGSVGIFESHNSCAKSGELEIGFWIGEPFWGRGLIPEAVLELERYCFEELGCDVLWCAHWDINEKSKRVQMKCGFVYHHTDENEYNPLMNDYRNHCVNILTREHWEEINAKAEKRKDCGGE